MNNNEFLYFADNLWQTIEDYLDEWSIDNNIDYESDDEILTINFKNGSKIIINRRESLQQVWMATKYESYHFALKECKWICKHNGENFWDILKQAVISQSNEKISIK